ncbi:MAG: nucleotidyltransferase family protein [Pseudomonadota bacterium]
MSVTRPITPSAAMVLAAGFGKRMRPLTDDRPKPLVQVAGKALIDYALDRFAAAGISKAVVNVHYLADQLEAHLSDRTDLKIVISDERTELLETGGGLKKARPHFQNEAVFCTNTDAILLDETDPEEACAKLAQAWRGDAMDALLLLAPIENTTGYHGRGDFDRHADGRIVFRREDQAAYVFTGLQIISINLIDQGPDGPFSTKRLWDRAEQTGRLFGVITNGRWLHVGDPDSLRRAESIIAETGA